MIASLKAQGEALVEKELESRRGNAKQASDAFRSLGLDREAQTVQLAALNTLVRKGESYRQARPDRHEEIKLIGIDACRKSVKIAEQLGDEFYQAEYLTRLGNGLYSAEQFRRSEQSLDRALAIWRRKAGENPDLLYRVVRALRHVANTCRRLTKYNRFFPTPTGPHFANAHAQQLYEEAVELGEGLGPDQRELAFSLGSMAKMYEDMGDYPHACECFIRCRNLLETAIAIGFSRMTEDPYSPSLEPTLEKLAAELAQARRLAGMQAP